MILLVIINILYDCSFIYHSIRSLIDDPEFVYSDSSSEILQEQDYFDRVVEFG